jgi:hypothetical protein
MRLTLKLALLIDTTYLSLRVLDLPSMVLISHILQAIALRQLPHVQSLVLLGQRCRLLLR